MSRLPPCLLYTQDAELARRLGGFLSQTAALKPLDALEAFQVALERNGPAVAVVDLRAHGLRDALPDLLKARPHALFIALGTRGSEPMIEAEHLGLYAAEDLLVDRPRFRNLVARAFDHLELAQENLFLRGEAAKTPGAPPLPGPAEQPALKPARHFPGALRHFDNVEALLGSLAEDVAGSALVTRVGIFCRSRDSDTYRLRAGVRCLGDARDLEFTPGDPFVRWITVQAHMVCRANLEHVKDGAARTLLGRTLDQLGAEVIVPLQARERLLGWLFVGHRSTGLPFEPVHLENLMLIAEHVSTTLENALLYEAVAVQKTLAETLLHSMPSGIFAVSTDGIIRWYNGAAHHIFEISPEKVLNQRVEILGSKLADAIRRALRGDAADQPAEWMDPKTKRTLVVHTRRLDHDGRCLGAVVIIQDVTLERMLKEKEEQLERATFWTELAASMSHEVRNPLVAIKTFAQLLPERYEDLEFRNQFSRIVSDEVDRLNGIIDQINQFAHPRRLEMRPLDVRQAIRRGLDKALHDNAKRGLWVDTSIDEHLPQVLGDPQALADCFSHIITNAVEAVASKENAKILLSAREYKDGDLLSGVLISVQDNGGGIPPDIRSKIFSPFCTTKARGMGLGLPIVKRTVVDHSGRVSVESSPKGTCVSVVLPSPPEQRGATPPVQGEVTQNPKDDHETHPDRG